MKSKFFIIVDKLLIIIYNLFIMIDKKQVIKISELITKNQNIVIFHHVNPDGDCMATSFGLAEALRKKYPNKNIKVVADIEDFTPHLRYMDEYIDWENTITKPEHNDYLAIIGDVSNGNRVRFFENFKEKIKEIIVYDHHQNNLTIDNVDVFWKESSYPAAALMTYELLNELNIEIDEKAALIINHGILTDTGWYKFSPGNKKVFQISGELNEIIGEELQKNFYSLMNQKALNEVKFHGWVLNNFKIFNNNISYICIGEKDLKNFDLKPEQAAKVNYLSGIENIESWLFFIQYPEFVRVEFRSKNIPVNRVAEKFGGGGHLNAAGCILKKMSEHKKVINEVNNEIEKL